MTQKIREILNGWYRALMNTPGKIDDVASGFAIGFFIGMIPWYGLQTVLSLVSTKLFNKNLAAGVLGSVTSNPITMMPIFYAEYTIGRWMLGGPSADLPSPFSYDLSGLERLWQMGDHVLAPILLGSIVLGLAGGAASFFIVRRSLTAYRRRVYLKRHPDEAGPDPSNP